MPEVEAQRGRNIVIAIVAVGIVALTVFTVLRTSSGEGPTATNVAPSSSPEIPRNSAAPSAAAKRSEPTPKPIATPLGCDNGKSSFNVDGKEVQSLLPDCGTKPVTVEQQKAKGLGLGCGGSYPTILYKTNTHAGSKTSVCGTNAAGEKFRIVTQAKGGKPIDLAGSYDPALDAFIAKDGNTTYRVLAYNGTLEVIRNGKVQKQTSDDWITLDNESDYD